MVSAGIPAPVWENKTLHVMSEDGNSRILRGKPYNNWSNVAAGSVNWKGIEGELVEKMTCQSVRFVDAWTA